MARERKERVNGPYPHYQRWRVVVTGADGSQTAQSFETEAEAQGVADAARRQSEGRTLMHALDAYETDMRLRDLAGCTIVRERAHLDKLIGKHNVKLLSWLTPARAAKLYETMRTTPTKRGKAPAVDSHRNALAAGRSFGRWCAARSRGWLPADPFKDVKGVGRRKRGKPQLTTDETRKLLDVCTSEGSRASLAVAACFLLGCGASEVVDRQVRDIDDDGRILHVTRGKNRYRVRALDLPDDLRGALGELAAKRPGAAWLFGASDLERPTRYWIYWHCRRLCRVAKVPEVSPHGLRGTHTTIALGAVSTSHSVRAALAAAGGSLGHAPGSPITASTYAAPGAVDRATQRAALTAIQGGRR
jgi:integrase